MVLSEIKSFLFKDTPAFALGKIFFLYVVLPAENCNKCKCLKQINCKVFAGYAYSRMYCCVCLWELAECSVCAGRHSCLFLQIINFSFYISFFISQTNKQTPWHWIKTAFAVAWVLILLVVAIRRLGHKGRHMVSNHIQNWLVLRAQSVPRNHYTTTSSLHYKPV